MVHGKILVRGEVSRKNVARHSTLVATLSSQVARHQRQATCPARHLSQHIPMSNVLRKTLQCRTPHSNVERVAQNIPMSNVSRHIRVTKLKCLASHVSPHQPLAVTSSHQFLAGKSLLEEMCLRCDVSHRSLATCDIVDGKRLVRHRHRHRL